MNGIKKLGGTIYRKLAENYLFFLVKAVRIGIFLTAFLPLVVIPSQIYLFQFGKVVIFRMIVEALLLMYIPIAIAEPKYRPRWKSLEISIALFTGIFLITSATGVDFAKSFWGTFERMGGFFTFAHYWLFFVIATGMLKHRDDWKKMLKISIFTATACSLYAFGQSVYFIRLIEWLNNINSSFFPAIQKIFPKLFIMVDQRRPVSTIGNAAFLASYLLLNIFFTIYILLAEKKNRERMIYTIGAIVMAGGLFLSGTRSAYLALLIGLICIFSAYTVLSQNKKIKIAIFAITAILILSAGFIFLKKDADLVKNNYILSRFSSIYPANIDTDITIKHRLLTWKLSMQGFKEKPLLGWGMENFNIAFNKYFDPESFIDFGSELWSDRAHNIFLDIAVTTGLLGLAAFILIFAIIYLLLFRFFRYDKRENIAIFSFILVFPIVYLANNFFLFDTFPTYLALFIFLGFTSNYFNNISASASQNPDPSGINLIAARIKNFFAAFTGKITGNRILTNFAAKYYVILYALLMLFVALTAYHGNVKPWLFQNAFSAAARSVTNGDNDSFRSYRSAMENSTYLGRYEAYKFLGTYVTYNYAFKSFKTPEELKTLKYNLNFSIIQLNSAINENPYDAELYLLLGKLYYTRYLFFSEPFYLDESEKTLKIGLSYSPKNQVILYEYGLVLAYKKDYDKLIEIHKYIKSINPNPLASWRLGMAYAESGQLAMAKSEIDEAIAMGYDYKKDIGDILDFAQIYVKEKDYDKAKSLYDEALQKDQNNANIYMFTSAMYEEMGDSNTAQKIKDQAILLDPSISQKSAK